MTSTVAIDPFSSLIELGRGLANGAFTALDLTCFYLDRIERLDSKLHAFVSVHSDQAIAAARASDERRMAHEALGPLDGLPIAVNDLCEIEGTITTFGSAAWAHRRSNCTADVVSKLRAAGMVILGKTHMVEFASGGWGTNTLMGTPWNPWDTRHHRIPGGSSSGSAVAVAAGLAPAAIGTDTGGSVRGPAALNGLTGLKCTAELISLRNSLPLSPTLDSIGPLCRTAADAALLTAVLADSSGAACGLMAGSPGKNGPEIELGAARVVVLRELDFPIPVEPEVLEAFAQAQDVFRKLGVQFLGRPLPFPLTDIARRYSELIAAEAWQFHKEYIEDPALPIGPAVRARIIAGKDISDSQYEETLAHLKVTRAAWIDWMADVDALMAPTLPMVACQVEDVDERTAPLGAFTRPANYFGACAISLPAGLSSAGLPIGFQLMAKPFAEASLLGIAKAFQEQTRWHSQVPDLASCS